MKFELTDASYGYKQEHIEKLRNNGFTIEFKDIENWGEVPIVTIDSLEDLMKMMDVVDNALVVSQDSIMIYDDYIE